MFIANITIHGSLFRSHGKDFDTILSFFYSLGENKCVYSDKRLPFNMKSLSPILKYLHIIESYAYIL